MARITTVLKSRRFIVTIGLLLLILLIWFVGGWFGLSVDVRFIAIFVLVVAAVVLFFLERQAQARGAAKLEQSLKEQAEDQVIGVRPEKREEIEHLRQQLTTAIDSLKKSKLGRGQKGRSALYALPWYMIIGPPAAGKTTAIKNSGLEFPFGADREIQGVGGTRNCDWWFSSSAILLDTAGRYTTEEEDRPEWLAFLDILKKHRRRRPINGVLVAISIAELLEASESDIEMHAKTIRKRIDELLQRLGSRFPVYLIFTKCDLISGFVDFFEDLSRSEREQVWGCTFTPEQQVHQNPRQVFEQEFDLISSRLLPMRQNRLTVQMRREKRGRVYAFPLGVIKAKKQLGHFVGKLFQPNPYQESPLFRGFYFTSGTQEGVPIDSVIQSVVSAFDLPPAATEEFSPEMETKAYFIRDLLTEIIIPDQNLVEMSAQSRRSRRLVRLGVIAGAALLLALFILGVSQAYIRSNYLLTSVADAAVTLTDLRWGTVEEVRTSLGRLETMRQRIVELDERASEALAFNFGMDRSADVVPAAYGVWFRKFTPFMRAYVFQELESRLRSAALRDTMINYLKAYLLLGSERARYDTTNARFLENEVMQLLRARLGTGVSEGETGALLRQQVAFFLGNLPREDVVPPLENNRSLVNTVRFQIYEPPSIQSIYGRIKREAGDGLQAFVMADMRAGYRGTDVPGLYTKAGWESYVQPTIVRTSSMPGKEDWVLGTKAEQLPPELRDPDKLGKALEQLYFSEYAEAWRTSLASIRYEPARNTGEASERLKVMADVAQSPLVSLLKNAADQTHFETGFEAGVEGKLESVVKKMGQKIGISGAGEQAGEALGLHHPMDRQFAGLHALVQGTGGAATQGGLATLIAQLVLASDELEAVKGDPGRARAAAADVLDGRGKLRETLQTIRASLNLLDPTTREALRGLFEGPVKVAWTGMLGDTQEYLNERWRSGVYEPFARSLGTSYPFDKSGRDAALSDVAAFFEAPDGTLWKFFDEELKSFIRADSWQTVQWEGSGITVSAQAADALRRASALGKVFKGGSAGFAFDLKPQVPTREDGRLRAPLVERICLTIDGTESCYQMGSPRATTYRVPGDGPRGASLEIYGRDGMIEALQYEGDWGWFRVLGAARVRPVSSSEYEMRWMFGKDYRITVRYTLRARSAANPFASDIFSFPCPNRLN